MSEWEFWSADRRFGLRVNEQAAARLLQFSVCSDRKETGGILVGFYLEAMDCALVTAVSGPPADSQCTKTWFARGVRGLQLWLERLWRTKGNYYLGEWHAHPGAVAVPSPRDIEQMRQIASSEPYRCPEPVLLIIGGDLRTSHDVGAFVFPHGEGPIELVRSQPRFSGDLTLI